VQKARILDVARQQFAEFGYDATTVAGIAEAAQVSRAIVYETVGDKEALATAVAEEVADEVVEALGRRFSAPDSADRSLEDLVVEEVSWFMELVCSDPARIALMQMAGHLGSPAIGVRERARRGIEDHLTALHLERYRAYGIERAEGARLLAVMVLALMESVGFRMATEPGWPADKATALVAQFVLGGYLQVEGSGRPAMDAFDRAATSTDSDDGFGS
jgi:AcrR family transcriptional regulator